jgi:GNAT superfamily N-acetyltransferase
LGYERDAIFGGAYGHIWGGWLDLSLLWVAGAAELLRSLRKKGYGRNLLEAAEDEAKAQGCRGVFLHLQLPGAAVLRALRLRGRGRTSDYPPGHAYYFMRKTLV